MVDVLVFEHKVESLIFTFLKYGSSVSWFQPVFPSFYQLLISVGLGWWAKLLQGVGSRLPRALEENRGMPQRNRPLWFSYRMSIADSDSLRLGFFLVDPFWINGRGWSNGVGSAYTSPSEWVAAGSSNHDAGEPADPGFAIASLSGVI